MERWPIGIFTSVGTGLGLPLETTASLGMSTIHLHAPAVEKQTLAYAEELAHQLKQHAIEVTCLFAGFEGESYADIPTVERTVGLVPLDTRKQRVKQLKQISDFGNLLRVPAVGLHIGFISHDVSSEAYHSLVHVVGELADYCRNNEQALHMETGQETATALVEFIQAVDRQNLFVNFDPANMILYGTGEPLPALERLGPYVQSVHCKDAVWSDQPEKTWGKEVPLGEGAVDMAAYLHALEKIGYQGPLTIEREIPHDPVQQREEIGQAVRLLNSLKATMT